MASGCTKRFGEGIAIQTYEVLLERRGELQAQFEFGGLRGVQLSCCLKSRAA